jgi:Bacterial Ig domain
MRALTTLALGACLFAGSASAATINVPADQATIQAAINAASNGDTVLVAPGTYYEKLDFLGKAITVQSSGGAAVTILDGQNSGPIVTFDNSEGNSSVLQGFTLTHANNTAVKMSGPVSPSILDNVFANNTTATEGAALAISGGGLAPLILRNSFSDNNCGGANYEYVVNISSAAVIEDNVFVNNHCTALQISVSTGTLPTVYNNTFVGNSYGLIVFSYTSNANASVLFSNNLIAFNDYGLTVYISGPGTMPGWSHNLLYGSTVADFQGDSTSLTNPTGTNGNISADPTLAYWVGGDVHLLKGSPAIDAGDSTVSQASATDFYGDTRVFAGKPGDTAIVDIGADEATGADYVVPAPVIINVPTDQPTIQAGIDAAADGNIVLVAPGTYYEQLNYHGKPITVKSSGGTAATVLDGNNSGPIVSFKAGEGKNAILQGFTLTHAKNGGAGGAIFIVGSSPTIEDNVFTANLDSAGSGAAIDGFGASPVIIRNRFSDNSGDDPNAVVSVVCFVNGSSPVAADNVFANNSVIAYNQLIPNTSAAPKIYNNTIVGNTAGLDLSFAGNLPGTLFSNNIIAFNQTGVEMSFTNGATLPPFKDNLVYGDTTVDYQGVASQTGTNGNISVDPRLKDWADGDVRLLYGSPAIDIGDSTVSQVSSTDFDGDPRVFAGKPGDSAIVDIGSVEFHPPLVAATDGIGHAAPNTAFNGTLTSSNADPDEPLIFALVSLSTHGTVTITDDTTGAFQYVPAQDYFGPDSFTFDITDPYGTVSNTATEQMTVADIAPTANDGSVETTPDTAVGGTLSASLAYPTQTLNFSLVSGPAHGKLSVSAGTGQFNYVPTRGFAGGDSFTFHVTDAYGTVSNVATETVTVNDLAPTAFDARIRVTTNRSTSGRLNATKAYNDQVLSYSVVSDPLHGTVTIRNASAGAYTYTASPGFKGGDSFTFQVADQWGTVSNVATVSVVVH